MTKPALLFLCTHNARRSQMALGSFNAVANGRAVGYWDDTIRLWNLTDRRTPTDASEPAPHRPRCADRTAMMPKRRHTRAQNRAHYIAAERRHNRQAHDAARRQSQGAYFGPAPPGDSDDEPPPSDGG